MTIFDDYLGQILIMLVLSIYFISLDYSETFLLRIQLAVSKGVSYRDVSAVKRCVDPLNSSQYEAVNNKM